MKAKIISMVDHIMTIDSQKVTDHQLIIMGYNDTVKNMDQSQIKTLNLEIDAFEAELKAKYT